MRGFATTLSIGILASMFPALVVTRVIFDILTKKKIISRLRMLHLIKQPNIDFIGKRRIAYLVSIIIIAIGLVIFAKKGEKNFGIDFTGGTVQQFKFANPVSMERIRSSLGRIGLSNASVQRFGGNKEALRSQHLASLLEERGRFPQNLKCRCRRIALSVERVL